jgi:hypothetical protein
LPDEWLSADLGLTKTDKAVTQLRNEYKRKMDEDTVRVKKNETTTKKQRKRKAKMVRRMLPLCLITANCLSTTPSRLIFSKKL